MQVIVNGEQKELNEETSVKGLVEALGLDGPVAVERNREVVPRAEHETTFLADGDILELVHFVGGG